MDKNIKVFLESPNTLELANEPKQQTKRQPKKKQARDIPYSPLKSIYEEQDLSKLTERQKLLAIKFQSIGKQASNLFLAVNDIKTTIPTPRKQRKCRRCAEDLNKLSAFVQWLLKQHICRKRCQMDKLLAEIEAVKTEKNCICDLEEKLYGKVVPFLNLACCKK